MKAEDNSVLWQFKNMFAKEVPRLPPKIDLDFSINIVPGAVPTSNIPYMTSTPKLGELKVQMK